MDSLSKPMGVGEMLDRSFQIYRKHFLMAFMLMLLFFGPVYLIQNLLFFDLSGLAFLPNSAVTLEESLEMIGRGAESSEAVAVGLVLFSFIFMPLYLIAVFPSAVASQLHLVRTASEGKPLSFKELLKKSFTPYWRMTGNTFLFGLMMIGIYLVLVLAVVIAVFLLALISSLIGVGFAQFNVNPTALGVMFVVFIVLFYVVTWFFIFTMYSFFLIRFGFYLPLVSLGREHEVLRGSWKLTRRSFWRIFAAFLVLSTIFTVFSLGIYALIFFLFKISLLGQLISVLLSLLILPLITITYGVIYMDLRVRNRGTDLERMLDAAIAKRKPDSGGASAYPAGGPAFGMGNGPAAQSGSPYGVYGTGGGNATSEWGDRPERKGSGGNKPEDRTV